VKPAALAEERFRFLCEAYGFAVTRSKDGQRESLVTFESETVRVGILIERPDVVEASVGRLEGGRLKENYGLFLLARDDSPEAEARLRAEPATLAERLETAAELLQVCGSDLLAGDFSRRDRLKRLRAEELRRSRKERFGTSTGETPRFETRPHLDELFSDAKNEGIGDARCVQAFWDYEYTLAEIAEFLEVSEEDVQARLDRWDGV